MGGGGSPCWIWPAWRSTNGFTLSLRVCMLLALQRLTITLDDLEYDTFMLSR
jgi:uncharacterized membrane protein